MSQFLDVVTWRGKGASSDYRPPAGTTCLVSGPHCDDSEGYVFTEMTILWCNEIFVLYGKDGCWPNLHKWDHVLCKPLVARETAVGPMDGLAALNG